MKAIAIFVVLGLLAGPALADRRLLQSGGPAVAPTSGNNSPPPAVSSPPPPTAPAPTAPQSACSCTASSDKSSGINYCFQISGQTTTVDCTIPAGYSCVAVRSQPNQITPQAGPIFSCTTASPPVSPPSPTPPAPVTPPTPTPPAPAPTPVVPKNCECTPSVGPDGPAYCMVKTLTPEGETTSTDCTPPAGFQCSVTEATAGEFAPIAGPVYKCGGSTPAPAPHVPVPPPAPHNVPVPAPSQQVACKCTPSTGPNGPFYCSIDAGQTTSTDCYVPAGATCKIIEAPAGNFAPVAGPVYECGGSSPAPPPESPVTPPTPATPSSPPPKTPVTPPTPDTPSTPHAPPAPETPVTPVTPSTPVTPAGPSDADVLNFLLNLETVEAEFYSFAVNGTGLNATLAGNGPASVGGAQAPLTDDLLAIAMEFESLDEQRIAYLRAVLGGAAVDRPQIDIGTAFASAANMAMGATLTPAFSPYTDGLSFLEGAFLFGDLQVSTYKGALSLISSANARDAVAGMMAAKAYQAGVIRELLFAQRATATPFGVNCTVLVQSFADLTNTLANSAANYGVANTTEAVLVPTDSSGIVFSRTPQQALNILYLGAAPGGFLPAGVNGPLGTSINPAVSG